MGPGWDMRLISEGRFELSSGSWTMTDEASPHFWATIDNIIEGSPPRLPLHLWASSSPSCQVKAFFNANLATSPLWSGLMTPLAMDPRGTPHPTFKQHTRRPQRDLCRARHLFRKSGVDNLIFQRIHNEFKTFLQQQKASIFEWKQLWG